MQDRSAGLAAALLMRFSWDGEEVDQSCVTNQTVVHMIQKQMLPQLSRADASAVCCLGHCIARLMLSSCWGEKDFPWHPPDGCSPRAHEDPAVPVGCSSTEPPGLHHRNHGENNPREGLLCSLSCARIWFGCFIPVALHSLTKISKIKRNSLFHLYACLGTGFEYENGALNRG